MKNEYVKRYYNVHNLISFSVEGNVKAVEHLCGQCEYFASDRVIDDVDLMISIGSFESIVDKKYEYVIVNRKYFVGNRVIFAEDTYKTAKWRLQIEDLDAKPTKFYFDGNGWTKYILHKSFVEVLLRYKLNQQGYLMIHSSSVAINGQGVVFPASPEAGKTSTMLNYLESGQRFMSDDFSLIGKNNVFAYPTPITLHSHNLKRHPFLKNALTERDKIQIQLRTLVLKATFGKGDISYKVDIWNKLHDVKVADQVPLNKLILITKYSNDKVSLRKMTRQEFAEKLLTVNYYETVLFDGYLKAYYYKNLADGHREFWARMRTNINDILTEDSYFELLLPKRYSAQEFSIISDMVNHVPANSEPQNEIVISHNTIFGGGGGDSLHLHSLQCRERLALAS